MDPSQVEKMRLDYRQASAPLSPFQALSAQMSSKSTPHSPRKRASHASSGSSNIYRRGSQEMVRRSSAGEEVNSQGSARAPWSEPSHYLLTSHK